MNNQEIENRLKQVEEIIDKIYEGLEIDWNDEKSRIFRIEPKMSIDLGVNMSNPWSKEKQPRYSIEFYQWHNGTDRWLYSSLVHPTVAAKYFPYLKDFIDFHAKIAAQQKKNIQSCIDNFNVECFITNKDGKDILVKPMNLEGLEKTTVKSIIEREYPQLLVVKEALKSETSYTLSQPRFPWAFIITLIVGMLFIVTFYTGIFTIISNGINYLLK